MSDGGSGSFPLKAAAPAGSPDDVTALAVAAPTLRKSVWRPSILDAYLLRMLAMPALGVLGVTLVAFLLDQTLRLINQLASNGAGSATCSACHRPRALQLGLALPASFFVAMFIVIARLDDNSELGAILAGGVSFERLAAPLIVAGMILGVVSLLLPGFLQPYSRFGYRAVFNAATEAGWTAQLDPQVFISAGPNFTITANRATPPAAASRACLSAQVDYGEAVVTASGATWRCSRPRPPSLTWAGA